MGAPEVEGGSLADGCGAAFAGLAATCALADSNCTAVAAGVRFGFEGVVIDTAACSGVCSLVARRGGCGLTNKLRGAEVRGAFFRGVVVIGADGATGEAGVEGGCTDFNAARTESFAACIRWRDAPGTGQLPMPARGV